MPRTLTDIFNDNPNVEIIEVVGYKDGGPFGLSSDGRRLKILDSNFARQLTELPDTDTETGHITDEGYCIHGVYSIREDSHKASVYRLSQVNN